MSYETINKKESDERRDFVAITNMRPALKEAIRREGIKANPPRGIGREVHELLEREYGAKADEIEREQSRN